MRLLEQAFSPTTINTGKGTEFEGAIVALSTPQDHWAHSITFPHVYQVWWTRDGPGIQKIKFRSDCSHLSFSNVWNCEMLLQIIFSGRSLVREPLCVQIQGEENPLSQSKRCFMKPFPSVTFYKVSPSREMPIQGRPACGSEVPYHDLPARQEDGTFWSLLPTNCLDPRVVFKIGMTWTTSNDGKLEVYIFLGSL